MSIESGPFLTMVTLGVAGLSAFPWQTLVGAVLPLVVGLTLGNLDRELRAFLARAVPVLIPFFAFALGAGINLTNVWRPACWDSCSDSAWSRSAAPCSSWPTS